MWVAIALATRAVRGILMDEQRGVGRGCTFVVLTNLASFYNVHLAENERIYNILGRFRQILH